MSRTRRTRVTPAGVEGEAAVTKSYACVRDLIPCGPSKHGFDAPGGGNVCYWSATFEVVARVYRSGPLDATAAYYFLVLDKRTLPAAARTIDDAPRAWEWRDEAGRPCDEPAGVSPVALASEADYYGRILPSLKEIEDSFFASFDETSDPSHYDVRTGRWVEGLPAAV